MENRKRIPAVRRKTNRVGRRPDEVEALRHLKLFATDVDGTLTDGGMYYTEQGEVMKRFDTRDAAGMSRLRRCGLLVAMVTSENSPIVLARARKLGMEHVYVGVEDKEPFFERLLADLGLDWDRVAYIGDDLNDLGVICRVGFSACPSDAASEVVRRATYVCRKSGGHGAVREVCDLILGTLESPRSPQ